MPTPSRTARFPHRWTPYAAAGLLALIGLTGCQSWKEVKQEAARPYLDMRSNLMLQMAEQQFASGQIDIAEKTVKDAAKIDPKSPKLHLMAGRIALERGRLERAVKFFETSIELDDKNPDPHYYKGIVLQRWQKWEQAYACYAEAYEREKDNPAHLLAMAEALVPVDKVDEGIALLESHRTYFDQSASLRASMGHLYRLKGDHAKAAELFKEAATLDPDNAKLVEELAEAQAAAGQHNEAVMSYERLLEMPEAEGRTELLRQLAHAQIASGQTNAARQSLLILTRENAATADDWINLAKLAWRDGDASSTLFAAHKITRMAPDRAEGYLLAGMVWQRRGHTANALRMFDRAADLDPTDPMPLVLRGVSLQKAGQPGAAAEAYRRALERQPGDTRAQRLLASVETD